MNKVMRKHFWRTVFGSTALAAALGGAAILSVDAAKDDAKPNSPIKQKDVAFGGKNLEAPMALVGDGQFADVLVIEGVNFSKGAEARALALGTLSLMGTKGSGDAIVQLRITIDGVPEPGVYSMAVFDGLPTTAPVSIGCNSFPADDQDHTVALEAAVSGDGEVTVEAGNFDFVALRPIFNPPLFDLP